MIEVYGNALAHKPDEQYSIDRNMTVTDWLFDNGIDRKTNLDCLPISINLNGDFLIPAQWPLAVIGPMDKVEICRMPKGTDPFSITAALVFGAKAVLSALMPKLPSLNTQTRKSGKDLDEASSKGNKVKINDVRPELAGFNPARYPDYLVLPRRYFAGPREQWIEMLLCVGVGDYQIQPSTIKVGETPLLSLGADASYVIYPPGAYLGGEAAHLFWYPAPEVGQGSTGTAGLELTASTPLTVSATASVFQYNSTTVSIPTGAGSFPANWTAGLLLAIGDPYVYSIADGTGTDGRDIISGGNVANLGFAAGDLIEIQGDNPGMYEVFSVTSTQLQLNYAGGAPATGMTIGNATMAIGFRGLRYRIVSYNAQALIVERLKTNGTTDSAWPGWVSNSSNAGRVQLDSSNLEGGYRGPFLATPPNEKCTAVEWDIFYPSGIVTIGKKGEYFATNTGHQFEWRDADLAGTWTVGQYSASGADLDAKGFTYRIDLPYPMRLEVRLKKLVVRSTDDVHDTAMWYGLKSLIPSSSPTSYAGATVMSVRIRGGDRISSQTENLVNLESTRILPVLRGGKWGAPQPTREISAWVGYVCRSIGYSDTQDLNIAELERLERTYWTPRGDFYDRIITDSFTVKEALIEALRVGFSELTIERGVITPVRDQPRGEVFDHVYNPQNMLDPLLYEFLAPDQPDDFDGVDATYFSRITLQNETVQCRLPGDKGERVEKITVNGVLDEYRAWRIGMRQRRSHIYRQKQYSFKTELDALNSGYLDYVALGVTTPGYGQSAFITEWMQVGAVTMLTASESFDWSKHGRYKLVVRRKDGSACGPYIATRLADNRFTIPEPDFIGAMRGEPNIDGPGEPPFLQFGHESVWAFPALIQSVSPSGTRTCSVKAVNYDERMYLDDDNFPPA
jgi:hypothetical protein